MSFRKFIRFFLLFTNAFFILVSVAALVAGTLVYFLGEQYDLTPTVATSFIGIATVSIIISISGFVAILKRSRKGIWIYYTVLLLLLGCQVAVVIIVFLLRDYTNEFLQRIWSEQLSDMSKNFIQYHFQCCGFLNPIDEPGTTCPSDVSIGCKESIITIFDQYSTYIYIGTLVLLSVQFIIALAIMIMNTVSYINDEIENEVMTLRNSQVLMMDDTIFSSSMNENKAIA